jgi:hypothetical protein
MDKAIWLIPLPPFTGLGLNDFHHQDSKGAKKAFFPREESSSWWAWCAWRLGVEDLGVKRT